MLKTNKPAADGSWPFNGQAIAVQVHPKGGVMGVLHIMRDGKPKTLTVSMPKNMRQLISDQIARQGFKTLSVANFMVHGTVLEGKGAYSYWLDASQEMLILPSIAFEAVHLHSHTVVGNVVTSVQSSAMRVIDRGRTISTITVAKRTIELSSPKLPSPVTMDKSAFFQSTAEAPYKWGHHVLFPKIDNTQKIEMVCIGLKVPEYLFVPAAPEF